MKQHFAQLSDPHLTNPGGVAAGDLLNKRALGYLSWKRKRRYEHSPEVLQALVQDLRGRDLSQLLVTGDLTHIGLPDEFRQAAEWLRELGEPTDVALVPGNHDACVDTPWEDTFALWETYMAGDDPVNGARFPTLRVRGNIAFIGLSTGVPKPPLMATGTAGPDQLAQLPGLLHETAARGLFRVVYLHHCPVRGREKWRKRLTDACQLQQILENNGAELVVHGHGHRRQFAQLTTCDGNLPVVQVPSASALALHGGDIAQYNHYTVTASDSGWHLDVDARVYDPARGTFAAGDTSSIALPRGNRPH